MSTNTAKVNESIDVPAEGMKWVKVRKIKWSDEDGKDVSFFLPVLMSSMQWNRSGLTHLGNLVFGIRFSIFDMDRGSGKLRTGRLERERLMVNLPSSVSSSLPALTLLILFDSSHQTHPPAVAIATLLSHPKKPLSTVIIEQFRPPIGKYIVELPAGLVDEGESAE